MIGCHRIAPEFEPGTRVVSARGRRLGPNDEATWEEMRVETVTSVDRDAIGRGHNARMTLVSADGEREVMLGYGGPVAHGGWLTLWTDPLPDDDAAALALVSGAFGSRGKAALFWIAAANGDGVAYAHQIADMVWADDEMETAGGLHHDPRAVRLRADDALESGTLVVGRLGRATMDDGVVTHVLGNARCVMRDVTLMRAADAFTRPPHVNTLFSGNFASRRDLVDVEREAEARAERSEALVLCWKDGGDHRCMTLAKTGIAFHHEDDPNAYAENSVPGEGLWMWRDVVGCGGYDHEGGYDYELDGDWVPATEADVLDMAGSLDAMASDIRDYTGAPQEAEPVERYMALARKVAAEDAVPA